MPFESNWINEPYILMTTYSGYVTGGDMDTSMLQYLGVAQAQPIYILLDFSEANRVPSKVLELSSISQVINHGNTRWFIIVSPEDQASYATRLLSGSKIKTFNDRASAIAFLRGMIRLDTGKILKD